MTVVTHVRMLHVHDQGLRVCVRDGAGGGPPLLIFNGIGANLELLQPLTEALDGIETVIFDVPGVGDSPAPILPYRLGWLASLACGLMTQLGYRDQIDVLGTSWGGALAQQFAFQCRRRCRRLILAATSSGSLMVPGRPAVLLKMVSPRRYKDLAYLHEVGPQLYGGALRNQPELLHEHGEHLRSPGGRGYYYQLLALWGWTSLPWLPLLRHPTLVMAGNDDPIIPLINAKLLTKAIPKAELHIVDDGHLFLVTGAREAAPVIRDFLTREAS